MLIVEVKYSKHYTESTAQVKKLNYFHQGDIK
jgi:hypothetical protein